MILTMWSAKGRALVDGLVVMVEGIGQIERKGEKESASRRSQVAWESTEHHISILT